MFVRTDKKTGMKKALIIFLFTVTVFVLNACKSKDTSNDAPSLIPDTTIVNSSNSTNEITTDTMHEVKNNSVAIRDSSANKKMKDSVSE